MFLEQTERSEILPVDIAVLKKHSRVPHDLEDDLYLYYLKGAVRQVEHKIHRVLVETKYDLYLQGFSDGAAVCGARTIELPRVPVASVESFEYLDTDDEWQDVPTTDYYKELKSDDPAIHEVSYLLWPDSLVKPGFDNVKISFTAQPSTIDEDVELALLELAAGFIRGRGGVSTADFKALPEYWSICALLSRKKRTEM